MRILVVKPTALGDVAQALCVAPVLKQWTGKNVHLTWLVDEDYVPLVKASPWVDEVIVFPRRRLREDDGGLLAWIGWLKSLRGYEFDLALDLQGLARSALMMRAVRAKRRIGLASGREGSRLACNELVPDTQCHAVERYLAAAHYVVGANGEAKPLPVPQGELPIGLQMGSYTVLHPYSLWDTKLWPWQNYEELARLLPEEKFVLVGRGAFFPVCAPNVMDLRNRTDLGALLLLLGSSRAVISTDSGPLHLAAAFDKRLLALFGATDPSKTSPYASRVNILTTELACRPCMKRRCGHAPIMECLQSISPQRVVEAWKDLVSK